MEKSLKDLLSRLPIPGLKESTERHSIADALTEALTIKIRASQIKFKDGMVTVAAPPVVKSALKIKQVEILRFLASQGIKAGGIR